MTTIMIAGKSYLKTVTDIRSNLALGSTKSIKCIWSCFPDYTLKFHNSSVNNILDKLKKETKTKNKTCHSVVEKFNLYKYIKNKTTSATCAGATRWKTVGIWKRPVPSVSFHFPCTPNTQSLKCLYTKTKSD